MYNLKGRNALLGISGKAGAGKDEFLFILNSYLLSKGYEPYAPHKFAGTLKEIARLLTGEPGETFITQEGKEKYLAEWGMTAREFLQKLGTDAIRNGLHTDAWVIATMEKAKKEKHCAITDVRFPNELKAVEKAGGITIRIEREGAGAGDHPSETALDTANFHFTFLNHGTLKEFGDNIKLFADNLINEMISVEAHTD